MERSFAQATSYGYQRARWRRLWRVQIQEYPTDAMQNIMILLKDVKEPANAMQMRVAKEVRHQADKSKPYSRRYGRSSLFTHPWGDVAGFYLLLYKLLPCHHVEIIG